MKSKIIPLALLLLIIPFVSAASTEINVKTLPGHTVFISIMDSTQTQYIKVLSATSNSKGKASAIFTDDTTSTFKIAIKVKLGENTILSLKKFDESYNAGESINIEYVPEGYVLPDDCDSSHFELCTTSAECQTAKGHWYNEVCNPEPEPVCDSSHFELCATDTECQTAEGHWYNEVCNPEPEPTCSTEHPDLCTTKEECKTVELHWYNDTCNIEEKESFGSKITGFFSFGGEDEEAEQLEAPADENSEDSESSFFSNSIFWIVIVGLIMAAVIVMYVRHRFSMPYSPKMKDVHMPHMPHNQRVLEHELTHAEKKLRAAQAEINTLKNKDKIESAKRKIEEDREQLRKLEHGEI